jgi:hypothetical protein
VKLSSVCWGAAFAELHLPGVSYLGCGLKTPVQPVFLSVGSELASFAQCCLSACLPRFSLLHAQPMFRTAAGMLTGVLLINYKGKVCGCVLSTVCLLLLLVRALSSVLCLASQMHSCESASTVQVDLHFFGSRLSLGQLQANCCHVQVPLGPDFVQLCAFCSVWQLPDGTQ